MLADNHTPVDQILSPRGPALPIHPSNGVSFFIGETLRVTTQEPITFTPIRLNFSLPDPAPWGDNYARIGPTNIKYERLARDRGGLEGE